MPSSFPETNRTTDVELASCAAFLLGLPPVPCIFFDKRCAHSGSSRCIIKAPYSGTEMLLLNH